MEKTIFDPMAINLSNEIVSLVNSPLVFSDLLIEQDQPIMALTPNGWVEVDELEPATEDDINALLGFLNPKFNEFFNAGKTVNCAKELVKWRLRFNGYLTNGGKKRSLSVRRIPIKPLTLKEIGLDVEAPMMLSPGKGLILINGPTCSGKTTTLASMLDHINMTERRHIVSIEEPIEFIHVRNKAIFSPREVGPDACSFEEGVKDAMRQRPDVIAIGEIRDRETAEQTLLAAESGVLVIGTIHANSAPGAIQKLLSFFPEAERGTRTASLASSLKGVISQLLVRTSESNNQRRGWALAAELLFNDKQQVSKILGSYERLNEYMMKRPDDDKMSRNMIDVMSRLVSSNIVARDDAVMAVEGVTQSLLRDALKKNEK